MIYQHCFFWGYLFIFNDIKTLATVWPHPRQTALHSVCSLINRDWRVHLLLVDLLSLCEEHIYLMLVSRQLAESIFLLGEMFSVYSKMVLFSFGKIINIYNYTIISIHVRAVFPSKYHESSSIQVYLCVPLFCLVRGLPCEDIILAARVKLNLTSWVEIETQSTPTVASQHARIILPMHESATHAITHSTDYAAHRQWLWNEMCSVVVSDSSSAASSTADSFLLQSQTSSSIPPPASTAHADTQSGQSRY